MRAPTGDSGSAGQPGSSSAMTGSLTLGGAAGAADAPPHQRSARAVVPRQRRLTSSRPRPGYTRSSVVDRWWWPPLLMLAVGGWGLGRPGAWTDELATWGAVRLSLAELVALSQHTDKVMAPYYAAMLVWGQLFGTSDIALRLPSLLALAAACALLVPLGARVASARAGLLAGLLLAVTPTISRYAQEQRMYAFAVLAAVLSTLLLHRAVERPSWRRFALYAGGVLLLGLTHPIALLILLAHGVAVALAGRVTLLRWSAACAAAAVPLAPLLYGAALQRGQVQWIPPVSLAGGPAVFAGVFGSAAVAAVLVVLALHARADAHTAALVLGWAVLPVIALWAVSLHSPLLLPRYLLFVLPAWALLAGIALTRVSGPRALATLLVFAVVGAPEQVGIRAVDGHGQDTKAAAAIITRQAAPGDAIAYSLSDPKGSWVARDLVARYVPADRRPNDVFQTRPQRVNGHLAADECPDPATCLGRPPRIWVVRNGHYPDPLTGMTPAAKERLLRERYRVQALEHPSGLTVAVLVAMA